MNYVKAEDILPDDLLKMIQQYTDGVYIYIPRKNEERKAWGENSGIRKSLKFRNRLIYKDYIKGKKVKVLSQKYYLSEQSIWRIINNEKNSLENKA
ncbi:CD3324 family protein [Clostridium neuense]|uniref:CD3324 family protein n=1 Tax=Clostridium neuense TaxID=1728934 RepID=A0ABW8TGM5_9CLOT